MSVTLLTALHNKSLLYFVMDWQQCLFMDLYNIVTRVHISVVQNCRGSAVCVTRHYRTGLLCIGSDLRSVVHWFCSEHCFVLVLLRSLLCIGSCLRSVLHWFRLQVCPELVLILSLSCIGSGLRSALHWFWPDVVSY